MLSQAPSLLYNIPESMSSAASSSTEAALSDMSVDPAGRFSFDSIRSVPGAPANNLDLFVMRRAPIHCEIFGYVPGAHVPFLLLRR